MAAANAPHDDVEAAQPAGGDGPQNGAAAAEPGKPGRGAGATATRKGARRLPAGKRSRS